MTNHKYIPYGDQILILPEEEKKQTDSGIYAPDTIGDQPKIALVVAVGKGKYSDKIIPNTYIQGSGGEPAFAKIPMDIKIGDRILYKGWGVQAVKMNDKEHFLLKQEDILAIVEEEEKVDNN